MRDLKQGQGGPVCRSRWQAGAPSELHCIHLIVELLVGSIAGYIRVGDRLRARDRATFCTRFAAKCPREISGDIFGGNMSVNPANSCVL